MKINNIEITYLSDWDGLPVKNHLPIELKEMLLTSNQWLQKGYVLKDNAIGYDMHPSALAKRTSRYYLSNEVKKMTQDSAVKCCLTCKYIQKNSYCVFAADFVGRINGCSEWISKENQQKKLEHIEEKCEDWQVRREVARNVNTPSDVLTKLAKDEDECVRWDVAGNKNTPSEVLAELAKDGYIEVRARVAGNENTPSEVLAELAKDGDWFMHKKW